MYIENANKVCHRKSELQNTGVHREFLNLGSNIHTAAKTNINHQIVSKYKAACIELEFSTGGLMTLYDILCSHRKRVCAAVQRTTHRIA